MLFLWGSSFGSTVYTTDGNIRTGRTPIGNQVASYDGWPLSACSCSNGFPHRVYSSEPACEGPYNCTSEEAPGSRYDYDTESIVQQEWRCSACPNGQTLSCYTGTGGTQGVGLCKAGTQTCTSSQWGSCSGEVLPSPEICDGKDNNCNETIDEGFDLGAPCSVGIGACKRDGQMVCSQDKTGTVCNATPGAPSSEICDGLDNNCNGPIDESCSSKPENWLGRPDEQCHITGK